MCANKESEKGVTMTSFNGDITVNGNFYYYPNGTDGVKNSNIPEDENLDAAENENEVENSQKEEETEGIFSDFHKEAEFENEDISKIQAEDIYNPLDDFEKPKISEQLEMFEDLGIDILSEGYKAVKTTNEEGEEVEYFVKENDDGSTEFVRIVEDEDTNEQKIVHTTNKEDEKVSQTEIFSTEAAEKEDDGAKKSDETTSSSKTPAPASKDKTESGTTSSAKDETTAADEEKPASTTEKPAATEEPTSGTTSSADNETTATDEAKPASTTEKPAATASSADDETTAIDEEKPASAAEKPQSATKETDETKADENDKKVESQEDELTPEELDILVEQLHDSMKGGLFGWGTDEKQFSSIMDNPNLSSAELIQIINAYNEKYGDFLKDVSKDFSGKKQDAYEEKIAAAYIEQAKAGDENALTGICEQLHNSTAGRLGTNEGFVNGIFDNLDDDTLKEIILKYNDVTGSDIIKDIKGDFSGKKGEELIQRINDIILS